MSDALKDFIENNREGFDDLEPGDLWTGIEKTIQSKSSAFNFKKLPDMFKYGFGASALVLGTILLVVNSEKETTTTEHQTTSTHIDSSALPFKTPKINAGAILLTEIKKEKKEPLYETNKSGEKSEVPSFAEQVKEKIFEKDTLQKQGAVTSVKPPYFLVKSRIPGDSIATDAYTVLDTLLNGIKKIEIKVEYCDVNIKAIAGSQVALHGKIGKGTGNFIVLGRKAFQRTENKIKFEKQDSVLKVWMETIKVNKKSVAYKEIGSQESVLNFEVPAGTGVEVYDQSGDVVVSGLENKNMSLQTSFGNIKADNIISDLFVKSSSGNITLTKITGSVRTENSFGDQVLESITGSIKLLTSSGNSTIRQLKGNVEASSSFGFQKYEDVAGNIISNVSSGNINIKRLKGNINATSSFGKQSFESIEGDVRSKASSGDITVADQKGMLNLATSFGDISGKNITLVNGGDFKTSSGNIRMVLLNEMKDLSFDLKSSSGDLLIEKNNVKNSSEEKLVVGQGPILVKGVSSFGDQSYK